MESIITSVIYDDQKMEILHEKDGNSYLISCKEDYRKTKTQLLNNEITVKIVSTADVASMTKGSTISRRFLDHAVSNGDVDVLEKLADVGCIGQTLDPESVSELGKKQSDKSLVKKTCVILLERGDFSSSESVMKALFQISIELLKDLALIQSILGKVSGNPLWLFTECTEHVVTLPSFSGQVDALALKTLSNEKFGFHLDMVVPDYETGVINKGTPLLHALARGNTSIFARLLDAETQGGKRKLSATHWNSFDFRGGVDKDAEQWVLADNPILVVLYFFVFAKSLSGSKPLLNLLNSLAKYGVVSNFDLQPSGNLPLMTLCAVSERKLQGRVREAILQLLAAGADPSASDDLGQSAVIACVNQQNSRYLKLLCPPDKKFDLSQALILAMSLGYEEEAETLIGCGATLSPMQLAVTMKSGQGKNTEKEGDSSKMSAGLLKKLVAVMESTASDDRQNPYDRLFLDMWTMSRDSCDSEVVSTLLDSGASAFARDGIRKSFPILQSALENNLDVFTTLVKHPKTPLNEQDIGNGQTILVWACAQGLLQVVRVLLENGADASRVSGLCVRGRKRLRNGLMAASESGNVNLVSFLVSKDPELVHASLENDGQTALHFASVSGSPDIIKILLENGADVNAVDANGRTALAWACVAGQNDAIKVMLHHDGCLIDRIDDEGLSPLDLCVRHGNTEGVRLLVAAGVETGY